MPTVGWLRTLALSVDPPGLAPSSDTLSYSTMGVHGLLPRAASRLLTVTAFPDYTPIVLGASLREAVTPA